MAFSYTDIQALINGKIVENTTQDITADDLNDLLKKILDYANEHNIADIRISSAISRVADMNSAINTAKNTVKTDLRGGVAAAGDTLNKLYNLIQPLVGGSAPDPIPAGIICMWSGTVVPPGWLMCNGSNGTPDLRGRFVVGYQPTPQVSDYDQTGNYSELKYNGIVGTTQAGKVGGSAIISLAKENLPPHHHEANSNGATIRITHSGNHNHSTTGVLRQSDSFDAGAFADKTVNEFAGFASIGYSTHEHTNANFTGVVGSGASQSLNGNPMNNRPPYYVLAYIMKNS